MDFKKLLKMFDNKPINEQVGPRSVSAVAQASGIADPNRIRPGQTINIPTAGGGMATTTVKPGDTLSGIIKRMQGQQNFRVAATPATQGGKPTEPVTPVPAQATPGGGPSKAAELARAQGKEVPSATTTSPVATTTTTTSPATAGSSVAPKSKEIPTITTMAPASTQAASPTLPPGKGAQTDAFGTPKPATAYADPEGTGSAAMPASDTEVRGGFGQETNITRDTPDQIARRRPIGLPAPEPSRPAVDAQGNRLQTKGFVDTVSDIFTKSPTPPAAAGVQSPNPEQFGVKSFVPSSTKSSSGQTQSVPSDTGMEMRPLNTKTDSSSTFAEEELQDLEEELNEMLRLSGIALTEKAVSKQQQKFMGMVHAMQKGKKIPGASPELKKVAKTMGKKAAKDFAATKHKGLPQKVSESVMLEAGNNLEHIVTRFKHETKRFLNGDELDSDLYEALYDYYADAGEMPYGVAKAREGDPFQWVSNRFESDLSNMGHNRRFDETVMPVVDQQLSELARLAGLSESQIDECGDMGMDSDDRLNVSTNMSSDGTKSVNISAQGEKAEELLAMLKLAGMGGSDRPAMVVVGNDEEMMEADRETEYANTPEEEYQTVASITRQGNDLNREKKQFANMPKAGDNPMATNEMLDEELSALLDSVLVREVDPRRPKGDTGIADIYTADKGQPPSPDEGPVGLRKADMKPMPLPKGTEPTIRNMPLPKGTEPRIKPM